MEEVHFDFREVHAHEHDTGPQTIEVMASRIEPKLTNDLLKVLSHELLLADLGLDHVKCVRRQATSSPDSDALKTKASSVLMILLSTAERLHAVLTERLAPFGLRLGSSNMQDILQT